MDNFTEFLVTPTPYYRVPLVDFEAVVVRKGDGTHAVVNSPRAIYFGQKGITVQSSDWRETQHHLPNVPETLVGAVADGVMLPS